MSWFPLANGVVRADLIAGATGALVLVPKAMAFAQLAGLPVHYGLYVALVPAIIAALWGSSGRLATGPAAIISLMTAAALAPFAVPFSEPYVELAFLLALMVGVTQLALGTLKLGLIVNFVSHPVILGFINAAAVIIALSQLDLLLGIPQGHRGSFLGDTWETLGYLPQTHLPTLAMSLFALALILALKRAPHLSQLNVLIAVAVTIVASAALGYERNARERIDKVADASLRELLQAYDRTEQRIREVRAGMAERTAKLRELESRDPRAAARARLELSLAELEVNEAASAQRIRWQAIVRAEFERIVPTNESAATLAPVGQTALQRRSDDRRWRIRKVADGELFLSGGGAVVGDIRRGLPSLHVPRIDWGVLLSLLPAALTIALVGFLQSIAMAKALAARTRERLDPDQELIGQGAANIGGAFFQSFPASGSFTSSAINLEAGAKTGLAMVFNAIFVAGALLALTPLLYHLPKATLGVIILLAVTSLITPAALKHTWRASRSDGIVALTTFVATLAAAPHLDRGIAIGAALAVLLYLLRTMTPRLAELGRHPDGALRDIRVHPGLPTTPEILALRFDDALYFANAAFFEEQVLEALSQRPQAKYLLIVGGGINQMDASGEEVVRNLVEQLRAAGVTVVFSGLKKQVLDVMRRTELDRLIGTEFIFANEDLALAALYRRLGREDRGELQAPPTGAT